MFTLTYPLQRYWKEPIIDNIRALKGILEAILDIGGHI